MRIAVLSLAVFLLGCPTKKNLNAPVPPPLPGMCAANGVYIPNDKTLPPIAAGAPNNPCPQPKVRTSS